MIKHFMTWTSIASLSFSVIAAEYNLPKNITWTAYDSGGAGYSQAVAIGAALKNEAGINLRILPGKNDISRIQPLRNGRVQFSSTGISGSYIAQEGMFEFNTPSWGPVPLRLILENNSGETNMGLGVLATSGIKEYSQLKGKRVAYVEGAPAVNIAIEGFLAYGGLTWDDVQVVRYGGYGNAWKSFIAGEVDAMLSITNAGFVYEAAAGPHGLFWPSIDPENKEGVERLLSVVPYFYTNVATVGANIDKDIGLNGVSYAYPVLVAMDNSDENMVYNMLKAMVELFPHYDGKVQSINGWALEKQNFLNNQIPYHAGAIKYFREQGLWSEEAQQRNDKLLTRQKVLQTAWDELKKTNPSNWEDAWSQARAKALGDAGLEITFN